jgi:hypothetical protein
MVTRIEATLPDSLLVKVGIHSPLPTSSLPSGEP